MCMSPPCPVCEHWRLVLSWCECVDKYYHGVVFSDLLRLMAYRDKLQVASLSWTDLVEHGFLSEKLARHLRGVLGARRVLKRPAGASASASMQIPMASLSKLQREALTARGRRLGTVGRRKRPAAATAKSSTTKSGAAHVPSPTNWGTLSAHATTTHRSGPTKGRSAGRTRQIGSSWTCRPARRTRRGTPRRACTSSHPAAKGTYPCSSGTGGTAASSSRAT